jgi:hypothetical protein
VGAERWGSKAVVVQKEDDRARTRLILSRGARTRAVVTRAHGRGESESERFANNDWYTETVNETINILRQPSSVVVVIDKKYIYLRLLWATLFTIVLVFFTSASPLREDRCRNLWSTPTPHEFEPGNLCSGQPIANQLIVLN